MCTPELHVCYALLWGAQYWTGQYPSDTGDEAKALKGAGEEAEHRSLGGDAPERRSGIAMATASCTGMPQESSRVGATAAPPLSESELEAARPAAAPGRMRCTTLALIPGLVRPGRGWPLAAPADDDPARRRLARTARGAGQPRRRRRRTTT